MYWILLSILFALTHASLAPLFYIANFEMDELKIPSKFDLNEATKQIIKDANPDVYAIVTQNLESWKEFEELKLNTLPSTILENVKSNQIIYEMSYNHKITDVSSIIEAFTELPIMTFSRETFKDHRLIPRRLGQIDTENLSNRNGFLMLLKDEKNSLNLVHHLWKTLIKTHPESRVILIYSPISSKLVDSSTLGLKATASYLLDTSFFAWLFFCSFGIVIPLTITITYLVSQNRKSKPRKVITL